MNRQERQLKRMFFKRLDKILSTSRTICKAWDTTAIPLNSLEQILKKSKPALTGDEAANKVIKAFNKTIDSLYDGCKEAAKKMGMNKVALSTLSEGVRIIKESFMIGLKEK